MSIFFAIGLFFGIAMFFVLLAVFWTYRNVQKKKEEALLDRLRVVENEGEIRITRDILFEDEKDFLFKLPFTKRFAVLLAEAGLEIPVKLFFILAGGLFLAVFLVIVAILQHFTNSLIIAALSVGILFGYVKMKHRRRMNAIDIQLPKALELMAIGLRAGHTLEDALRLASTNIQPPLQEELTRVYEEYEMGRPITEALVNLAARLSSCQAVHVFVESILVLKQAGGNLVEIIEQIIDSIRSQAAFEVRYRSMTAEGRTSGMIIGGLPLVLIVVLMFLNPQFLHFLFYDPAGHKVLYLAGTLWSVGIFWVYRLVKPAV